MHSELENAKAAAERKKEAVRAKIAELRKELEQLAKKNLQEDGKKIIANFVADPEYIEIVRTEQEAKIEEVHTELAWGIEYHEMGIRKLKERFLAGLDNERIDVSM